MVSANLLRAARIRISAPSIAVIFFHPHVRQYHRCQTPAQRYICSVGAEPLHRYRPGGYHPIELGDSPSDGRYRVLHKLGWGSYSTTWAAKDQLNDRYVALKITVAEAKRSKEIEILQKIAATPRNHPGSCYLNQLLELVGPNVADVTDSHCRDDRLPSQAARVISRQVLQGLDYLASNGIGHGGRRIMFQFIIDFGEAFFNFDAPNTLHTPLPIFELVTGQYPFNVVMLTPPMLVQQMVELIDDELPSRWQEKWQETEREALQEEDAWTLQSWMEEVYFDNDKPPEFTRRELRAVAKLIARLMRFEPSIRATPSEGGNESERDKANLHVERGRMMC
ncbi:kinase-like domain-containing protein [Fusarium sp. MPI-SDFR-AT-0072]|nr:kinase-like domain-containing protein [Fusarium sp. MPI-SDFR-AT-0072]